MALVSVLRAYVARNGNNEYTAWTVDQTKIGTYQTAGAAQRATDHCLKVHLKWTKVASLNSTEQWEGTEAQYTP